jgi:histidine triad (HIT) family protein
VLKGKRCDEGRHGVDCIFCKIAAGDIPAEILYQDEEVLAFRDVDPQAPSHILVIPRRHIASAFDLETADADLLAHIFQVIREVAHGDKIDESGTRILTNVGRAAGQAVFHLHFHVLGGRQMLWPPG